MSSVRIRLLISFTLAELSTLTSGIKRDIYFYVKKVLHIFIMISHFFILYGYTTYVGNFTARLLVILRWQFLSFSIRFRLLLWKVSGFGNNGNEAFHHPQLLIWGLTTRCSLVLYSMLINKVNFANGVGNRKPCLQLYFFEEINWWIFLCSRRELALSLLNAESRTFALTESLYFHSMNCFSDFDSYWQTHFSPFANISMTKQASPLSSYFLL